MDRVVTLALSLSIIAAAGFAQPRLDQEQVNLATTLHALGGTPWQRLAQVFTPARDGFVSHAAFPMNCQPATTVAVRIEETTAGMPNGLLLGGEDVPGTSFTSFPTPAIGFRLVQFRHPVRVSAGVQYAVILEASGGDCGIWAGPAGDSYLGGQAFFESVANPPGWLPLSNSPLDPHDLAFQIYTTERRSGR